MRAAADNFTVEEIHKCVEYSHNLGKKVYLTLNTMPHWYEYEDIKKYLCEIAGASLDAMIVADVGVLDLVKEAAPNIPVHISTQAGAVSHADCIHWYKSGASRVVLARELSFEEIKNIKSRIPSELELECFIHGSMCVSYSGRCLLSNYLTGRDGNRGFCAQPCRWEYRIFEIEEAKRPGTRIPVEQDKFGTFVMSSKDLCMIEHIPELMESGISSFKIEGRMKSAYYTAVCANTYKMAMDAYVRSKDGYRFDPLWLRELESVTHREYSTGFYFDSPGENAQIVSSPGYLLEKSYLAFVESYDPENGRATLIQKNKMFDCSYAELLTPGSLGKRFYVEDMRDADGNKIADAPHPAMRFTIKAPFMFRAGDIVRMA